MKNGNKHNNNIVNFFTCCGGDMGMIKCCFDRAKKEELVL